MHHKYKTFGAGYEAQNVLKTKDTKILKTI